MWQQYLQNAFFEKKKMNEKKTNTHTIYASVLASTAIYRIIFVIFFSLLHCTQRERTVTHNEPQPPAHTNANAHIKPAQVEDMSCVSGNCIFSSHFRFLFASFAFRSINTSNYALMVVKWRQKWKAFAFFFIFRLFFLSFPSG